MSGPKLQVTKDYDLFELHDLNRLFHKDKRLESSMKKHGFMPSSPLQCVKNGNGKLKIVRGHHRFDYARQLGLPVWYIIDETNQDIYDLESTKSQWSTRDFVDARAKGGDEHCLKLLDFMKKHALPVGAAASLVGGESAGSHNKISQIKPGTFRIGDLKHANQVVRITDRCRELKIVFSTSTAFVSAVSFALRIPEFNIDLFIHRLDLNGTQMRKRGKVDEYLEEIEALYNYGAHKTRLPIAFRAREVARERAATFGKIKHTP
jgi:hypothetical protein